MKPTDEELEAMAARLEDGGVCSPAQNSCRNGYLMLEAAAMLRACKGRVRVKPLEWYGKPEGQDQRIGRCGDIAYSVRFAMGSWGYTRSGKSGLTVGYKGGPRFKDEADAINGADVDHEFRILAALEPAPDQGEWDAAIEAAIVNLKTYAPHQDGTGPEHDIGYAAGYHTALNRLQDIKKGQTND